ncbi:MAG TPA: hypothetical protein PK495_05990 [Bacteroidales bacterium]|nr:hypothetical protein [Bacteroidales bacterium]
MKKLFILFTVTFISLQTFSQSITVSFTGKKHKRRLCQNRQCYHH